MPLSSRLREMVLQRASALEIKRQALRESMLSLRMDGLLKMEAGVTSPEEVLKETSPDEPEILEELRKAA
ncbi:MAG: hypothetical protein GF355_01295 [Candidatus Eisenbacteria bacterium]|nr:hypothetical protein [Candidatus Eisenbacteria bacterium]